MSLCSGLVTGAVQHARQDRERQLADGWRPLGRWRCLLVACSLRELEHALRQRAQDRSLGPYWARADSGGT